MTGDATYASRTNRHIGFWIANNTIQASVADGTTNKYTQIATGITANQVYLLEVKFTAGVKAEFYINNSLVYTETSNLPTGKTNAGYYLDAELSTNYNDVKEGWILYWDFWQSN